MAGLNLDYRFTPGIGLEAKYSDAEDAPHNWRKSLLPSVDAASKIPGELEKMIEARDAAVIGSSLSPSERLDRLGELLDTTPSP